MDRIFLFFELNIFYIFSIIILSNSALVLLILLKVIVTIICNPPVTGGRVVRRAGGYGTHYQGGWPDCKAWCNAKMTPFGACCGPTEACDPYHIRCFDSQIPSPSNGLRVAFASQIGTTAVDPALSQMNISDTQSCWRMLYSNSN